jgi:methionyl-tRNA formyltransferase
MDHLLGKVFVEYLSAAQARPHPHQAAQEDARRAIARRAGRRALMRVVFAGTPVCRTALAPCWPAGHDGGPLVLTQPDRPAGRGMKLQASAVKQVAQARGVPWRSRAACGWTASTRTTPPPRRPRCWPQAPDVMVVAAYGLILPPWVLACHAWAA